MLDRGKVETLYWMPEFPNSIDLRQLKYFIAACEQGSFRKAGLFLNVRESAISRRIRDLETRLGVTLFRRYAGGVIPTRAGQHFLISVRKVFLSLSEAAREAVAADQSATGCLRIGMQATLTSGLISELLCRYAEQHPHVHIELIEGAPEKHVASVRAKQIDAALVVGEEGWAGCDIKPLWRERVYAALPEAHQLAVKTELTWNEMAGATFISCEADYGHLLRHYWPKSLVTDNMPMTIQLQSVGHDNLMTLIAMNKGLTVVGEAKAAISFPGVIYRPISDASMAYSAVWSPANENPALQSFLEIAKTFRGA